jgi:hypothetical protein
MPRLVRTDTGRSIGDISEEELQQIVDALVEESDEDTEYFIDEDTLAYMRERGLDEHLVALLRAAIGEEEGLDIAWER